MRGVAQLIADVTEFMTLQPGDVLLLGLSHGSTQARAGQSVAIGFAGMGRLVNVLRRETVATPVSA